MEARTQPAGTTGVTPLAVWSEAYKATTNKLVYRHKYGSSQSGDAKFYLVWPTKLSCVAGTRGADCTTSSGSRVTISCADVDVTTDYLKFAPADKKMPAGCTPDTQSEVALKFDADSAIPVVTGATNSVLSCEVKVISKNLTYSRPKPLLSKECTENGANFACTMRDISAPPIVK